MTNDKSMKDFRVCPQCGYGRGFHVYFTEAENGHRIGLICPSCGQSYDLGWVVQELDPQQKEGPRFESR